jgi:hypothetical protein
MSDKDGSRQDLADVMWIMRSDEEGSIADERQRWIERGQTNSALRSKRTKAYCPSPTHAANAVYLVNALQA